VTGAHLPRRNLVRFVLGPDQAIVPDVAEKLPGRGLWVTAERETITRAATKGLFARAAKSMVKAPDDLAARVEALLAARALSFLGLARRAGELILGFESVAAALRGEKGVGVLIAASDGAEDGRRKLERKRGDAPIVACFTSAEMGLALARENVIHAALNPGRLAVRFLDEALRLSNFRPGTIIPE
jgi:predicted RNA-binding protein YlxR (DUF448 family)